MNFQLGKTIYPRPQKQTIERKRSLPHLNGGRLLLSNAMTPVLFPYALGSSSLRSVQPAPSVMRVTRKVAA